MVDSSELTFLPTSKSRDKKLGQSKNQSCWFVGKDVVKNARFLLQKNIHMAIATEFRN